MWFLLIFFILPGLFCGLAGGGGALVLSAVQTVWCFCAGAAAGFAVIRWGEKQKILSMLAPFAIALLMVPAGTWAAVLAAGFTAGIVSALPERFTGRAGKFFFVLAAVAGIFAIYFAGAWRFSRSGLGIISMLLPLPAVLSAGWHGLRGGRIEKAVLSLFMVLAVSGIAVLQLFFPQFVNWSKIPGRSCFYRISYPDERDRNTFDLAIHGGRTYRFPDAYRRAVPAVIPASLEPDKNDLRALFVGEAPSGVPSMLETLPWVKSVDRLVFAPPFSNFSGRYDLILVSELPGHQPERVQAGFIRYLKENCLAPDGVLVYPANGDTPLPGVPEFAVWQQSGKNITADINEIDRRLSKFSPDGQEILPAGLLETLYSLVPEESSPELKNAAPKTLPRLNISRTAFFIGAGVYLILRFLLGRYPGVTPCAEALEQGLAAGIAVYAGAALHENTLLSGDLAAGVLPLLLVCFVPGLLFKKGRADVRTVTLFLIAASGGVYLAPLFPGGILVYLIALFIIPGLARL